MVDVKHENDVWSLALGVMQVKVKIPLYIWIHLAFRGYRPRILPRYLWGCTKSSLLVFLGGRICFSLSRMQTKF